MFAKFNKCKQVLACLLITGMGLTSCMDNSYDLDEVDMTIGSNVNLTLPVSSTGSIYLKNIIDLEEDGVVQLVDDIYYVKESGSANVPPIHINEIRIHAPKFTDIDATLDLRDMLNGGANKAPGKRKVQVQVEIPGLGTHTVEIPNKEYAYDIKNHQAEYAFPMTKTDGISTDVVSIKRIGIDDVEVTLNLTVSGLPDWADVIKASNLTLSIPAGFEYKNVKFMDKTVAKEDIKNNSIPLTGSEEVEIHTSKPVTMSITFTGMNTDEGSHFHFDAGKHEVSVDGSFELVGTFTLRLADIDQAALNKALKNETLENLKKIVQEKTLDCIIPTELNFHGEAKFGGDILVDSFTGDVCHEVGDIDPIMLNDLPDFLNEDDVVLDLKNPLIFISADNQIPADAKTSITLTSKYTNGKSDVKKTTKELTFFGNGAHTSYYLADHEADAIPTEYKGATFSQVKGLGELITKIPKQINVDVAPINMHVENVNIRRDYEVDVKYDVFAPLEFGKNFNLVYRDTETGWAEDLDLEDMSDIDGSIELNALIDSNLDTKLILKLIPLDINGDVLNELKVTDVTIDANAKNFPIKLALTAKDGYTLNDILNGKNGVEKLDGIRYEARLCNPSDDAVLKGSNEIRLHDIKVNLKATVAYDAN